MNIRTARYEDLDAIAQLESVCFPPEQAAGREEFASRLAVYSDYFWLLEEDGKLISFVDGMVTNQKDLTDEMYENASLHEPDGRWQMIFGVNTHPDWRRQGLAERVLRRVIADAKAQGREGVVLTCVEDKIHYYSKFGFFNEGVSQSVHGDTVWYQMRLTFPEPEREKNAVIIRRGKAEDAAAMLDYLRQAGSETDNLTFGGEGLPVTVSQEEEWLRNLEQSDRSACFVAELDGKIVGDASFNMDERARLRHRGELGISVLKTYWNKGIGRLLMEAVICFAREVAGAEIVQLDVRSDNARAIHLYESFGFQKIGHFPGFMKINGEWVDAELMNLYLDQ